MSTFTFISFVNPFVLYIQNSLLVLIKIIRRVSCTWRRTTTILLFHSYSFHLFHYIFLRFFTQYLSWNRIASSISNSTYSYINFKLSKKLSYIHFYFLNSFYKFSSWFDITEWETHKLEYLRYIRNDLTKVINNNKLTSQKTSTHTFIKTDVVVWLPRSKTKAKRKKRRSLGEAMSSEQNRDVGKKKQRGEAFEMRRRV